MSNPKKTSRKKPAGLPSFAASAAVDLRAPAALRASPLAARALPEILLTPQPAAPLSAKLLSGLPASARGPSASPPPAVSAAERRERIARAAYRRAEGRGRGQANPLEDWLLAEREIDALIAARGG